MEYLKRADHIDIQQQQDLWLQWCLLFVELVFH
jgi:hypothetical protein